MRHCDRKTSARPSVGLQLPIIRQSGACQLQSPPDQSCSVVQSITQSPGALITCHMFNLMPSVKKTRPPASTRRTEI